MTIRKQLPNQDVIFMLFVLSTPTTSLWFGMGCPCVCLHYVCDTSRLRFHHCPNTLQRILLNFKSIL